MARNAQVFKLTLAVADLDRSYFETHEATLAQHPSETDLRLMWRVAAMGFLAASGLAFGRGISTEDEPDIWRRDDTGDVLLWVDLGLPDERRIRKACGRATEVVVLPYGGRAAPLWWKQIADSLTRFENLDVRTISADDEDAVTALVERTMSLTATIQDETMLLTNGALSAEISMTPLLKAGRRVDQ